MHDTVIYLGPTLSRAEAESVLPAEYRPPIRRGDLAQLPDRIRTVGIVDGEFYQSLAISTKEILVVLRRGVTVFGAASIGALRAAETCTLGMRGVGRIFSMYRDGVIDADDEVALVYDPETFRKISEPLVNIRHVVSLAVSEGILDNHEADSLIAQIKSHYFPDRTYHLLQRLCPKLGPYVARPGLPDLKREDALALLHAIKQSREQEANQE